MFRGFYTAASGMLTQQRRTEMLANNMANANTPGFKADQTAISSFSDMLLQRIDSQNIPTENGFRIPVNETVGSISTGVYLQEAMPLYTQGDLNETGLATDLSLENGNLPDGTALFFTVAGEDGNTKYTRNGNFTLDSQGYLTSASGLYVLDQNGNRIQPGSESFTVNDEGYLTDAAGNTTRIGVAYAETTENLLKQGEGLFATEDNTALQNGYGNVAFRIQQGFLERSNVDTSRTMTDMMASYRTFEANQKVLQAYDRSMEKAVNEVGRLG